MGLSVIIAKQRFVIEHNNNIPTMQLFTGISRNTILYVLLMLTECVRDSKIMHCGILIKMPHYHCFHSRFCRNFKQSRYRGDSSLIPWPAVDSHPNSTEKNGSPSWTVVSRASPSLCSFELSAL